MHAVLLLIVLLATGVTAADNYRHKEVCHRKFHNNPDTLNVHIVPHTHDDAGWLKTVDQYFYGSNPSRTTDDAVQYILDGVIEQLWNDHTKWFSYCEIGFFTRWYRNADRLQRDKAYELVQWGHLQFIGGGWVQNDEACTHYVATIDQMSLGLRFINDTFGPLGTPVSAWQIDPFGHAKGNSDLYRRMGFTSQHFARLHHNDYDTRLKTKTECTAWQTDLNKGNDSVLPTCHFYQYNYDSPHSFCFDDRCPEADNPPIMDDPTMEGFNLEQRVTQFIGIAKTQAKYYRTNHIMFLMGEDFAWRNAGRVFKNLDKLMGYANKLTDEQHVHFFYSNPSCYFDGLLKSRANFSSPMTDEVADEEFVGETANEMDEHRHTIAEWNVKTDDFFPYANKKHSYWAGYFTSRPTFKAYIREMSSLLQMAELITTTTLDAAMRHNFRYHVAELRNAVALCQHHDAVTGTAKQVVTNDYMLHLSKGQSAVEGVLGHRFFRANRHAAVPTFCRHSNETTCLISQFDIIVTNRLHFRQDDWLQVPFDTKFGAVKGPILGVPNLIPTFPLVSATNLQFEYVKNRAKYVLWIPIALPPLGTATITVHAGKNITNSDNMHPFSIDDTKEVAVDEMEDAVIVDNKHLRVELLDSDCSRLLVSTVANINVTYTMRWNYYTSATWKTKGDQASGAYIFRPASGNTTKCSVPANVCNGTGFDNESDDGQEEEIKPQSCSVVQNSIGGFTELHIQVSCWMTYIVRIHQSTPTITVEWMVGPVPIADKMGREIVFNLDTDLHKDDSGVDFYTDSNGRQMVPRHRNFQSTYEYENDEPQAGNYYPINTVIAITGLTDDIKAAAAVTVITDRSQGGWSPTTGAVEIMVHRRILEDDNYGVNEPLNEPGVDGRGLVVKGRFLITLSSLANMWYHRVFALESFTQPTILYAPLIANATEMATDELTQIPMSAQFRLPLNVHILSLQSMRDDVILLRLEHYFDVGESLNYSKPAVVHLEEVLPFGTIVAVYETSLAGDRPVQGVKMTPLPHYTIQMLPFDIRTFKVYFKY